MTKKNNYKIIFLLILIHQMSDSKHILCMENTQQIFIKKYITTISFKLNTLTFNK